MERCQKVSSSEEGCFVSFMQIEGINYFIKKELLGSEYGGKIVQLLN